MQGPIEERTGYAGLDTLQPLTGWFMHEVSASNQSYSAGGEGL
jgi:hypothetical protein